MSRSWKSYSYMLILLKVVLLILAVGFSINSVTEAISNQQIAARKMTVVIDAGHGGEDGGATSCSGILESQMNLEIACKLNDLMRLFGVQTIMIRKTDVSVYTSGKSLSEKKISDLKNRIEIIKGTPNPVLISIHQNYYPDSRYSGAQVFYAATDHSKVLAEFIQQTFRQTIDPYNKRNIKSGNGIYLLEKSTCHSILVECGFLSNPKEEAKLKDSEYQNKICCVILSGYSQYLYQFLSVA